MKPRTWRDVEAALEIIDGRICGAAFRYVDTTYLCGLGSHRGMHRARTGLGTVIEWGDADV